MGSSSPIAVQPDCHQGVHGQVTPNCQGASAVPLNLINVYLSLAVEPLSFSGL